MCVSRPSITFMYGKPDLSQGTFPSNFSTSWRAIVPQVAALNEYFGLVTYRMAVSVLRRVSSVIPLQAGDLSCPKDHFLFCSR